MNVLTAGRLVPIVLLASACLALAPLSVAQAGSCPTCTASSECGGSKSIGFCVVHDGPVGCGELVTICCPGQGCAINGEGRPTCEAAGTCTVIEDIEPDAGMSDAGMSDAGTSDSGIAATDAGGSDAGGSDAGISGTDSGVGMDGGGVTPVEGGCSCRVPSSSDPSSALAWVSIAVGLMLARRRIAQNE